MQIDTSRDRQLKLTRQQIGTILSMQYFIGRQFNDNRFVHYYLCPIDSRLFVFVNFDMGPMSFNIFILNLWGNHGYGAN